MYDPMNINSGQPQNPENTSGSQNPTPDANGEYHSGYRPESQWQNTASQNTGYQNNPYSEYAWQGSNPQPYDSEPQWPGADRFTPGAPAPRKPKKERRPMSRGAKLATKIVAGVLCCALVSAASVGGFAALINNGVIQVNNAGSGDATFTINKLINSDENNPTTTVSGDMTQQEVAAKVLPSVVCIQNYQQASFQQGLSMQGWGNNQNSTQQETRDSEVSPTSEGSGIIATSDGYIITNAHVVDGADSLKVITSDGKTYEAELIGSDSMTDLAVIKVDAEGLTAAEFGSSSDLVVADPVIAIGNPGGLQSTVTVGYVSALTGNSGGALVNMYGQVIGINSSKIVATGYEGLGFAIPIDDALPIISNLKDYGYVKDRAMLGISGQYLDSWTANFYGLPSGMYVAEVNNESVSDAGVQQGDVITKIDDEEITSANTISNYIAKKKPGDEVTLTITRSLTNKTFTCKVTLTESTGQ